jgi:hypothetical protein
MAGNLGAMGDVMLLLAFLFADVYRNYLSLHKTSQIADNSTVTSNNSDMTDELYIITTLYE